MPQMQLPIFPVGLTHINNLIEFEKGKDKVSCLNIVLKFYSYSAPLRLCLPYEIHVNDERSEFHRGGEVLDRI